MDDNIDTLIEIRDNLALTQRDIIRKELRDEVEREVYEEFNLRKKQHLDLIIEKANLFLDCMAQEFFYALAGGRGEEKKAEIMAEIAKILNQAENSVQEVNKTDVSA